jgi:hypothetical protein
MRVSYDRKGRNRKAVVSNEPSQIVSFREVLSGAKIMIDSREGERKRSGTLQFSEDFAPSRREVGPTCLPRRYNPLQFAPVNVFYITTNKELYFGGFP